MGLLEDFFERNVEGFLFNDLDAVSGTGASYPAILTCFAGIELLGAIVSPTKFNRDDGRLYFSGYWRQFLYPALPSTTAVSEDIYKFVRHGVAHAYVMKGSFGAGTAATVPHLSRTPDDVIYIDAAQLAKDLRESYAQRLLPAVAANHVLAASMAKQVKEIRDQYDADAKAIRKGNFPLSGIPADKKAISQSFAP